MSVLRKLGVVLIFIASLFGAIVFLGPQVVEKPVTETVIHKLITMKVMDTVSEIMGDSVDSSQLLDIQNAIDDNQFLSDVSLEYFYGVKKLILEKGTNVGSVTEQDLDKYMDFTAIDKCFDSFGRDLINELTGDMDESAKNVVNSLYESMMPPVITAIKQVVNNGCITALSSVGAETILYVYAYSFVTSIYMKIIIGAITVLGLLLAFACHYNKSKALFNVGAVSLASGLVWIAVSFAASPFYSVISNKLIGRTIFVDTKVWLIYACVLTITGVVFMIIGKATNRRDNREARQEQISNNDIDDDL